MDLVRFDVLPASDPIAEAFEGSLVTKGDCGPLAAIVVGGRASSLLAFAARGLTVSVGTANIGDRTGELSACDAFGTGRP